MLRSCQRRPSRRSGTGHVSCEVHGERPCPSGDLAVEGGGANSQDQEDSSRMKRLTRSNCRTSRTLARSLSRGAVLVGVLLGAATTPARAAPPPAAPGLGDGQHFTIDPIVDGMFIVGGTTFSVLLNMIISTGELRPGLPSDPKYLLSIDRVAVTQTIDPKADGRSNVGLWAAYGYAVLDPILSGLRDGRRAFAVDAVIYAESFAITESFTLATKIGVRRPRPLDYYNCQPPATPETGNCSSTDLQLSFFSGHSSQTASLSATATYLAFARRGWRSPRPWITLGVGTLLTAFVSYERVRSGYHFPTDVIMGSMAGAGIGVLVPHLHRRQRYHEHDSNDDAPPVVIGYAPLPGGGGSMTMSYRF